MKYELTPYKVFSNIMKLPESINDQILKCKTEDQLDKLIRANIREVWGDVPLNKAIREQRTIIIDEEYINIE